MSRSSRIASLLVAALIAASASPATVVLNPSKDNTLFMTLDGSQSNGSGSNIIAGVTMTGQIRRALLAFDLSSQVPPGSQITAVTLTLHVARTVSASQSMTVHRVLATWGEGASNAGTSGLGAASAAGDATWIHRFYRNVTWATPGGDFDATADATVQAAGVGDVTWQSTPGLIATVQGWIDQPTTNFGWIMVGNEATTLTTKSFDSRQSASTGARPRLQVDFIAPPPPRGDVNGDGFINSPDIFYLVNFLFAGGLPPVGPADVNGDGSVTVADIFYLINFLFAGGPGPR